MTLAEETQKKLDLVYKKKLNFENLTKLENYKKEKALSSPFILNVSDEYFNNKYKIMFIGKEPNSWFKKLYQVLNNPDLISVMKNRYKKEFDTEPKWKQNAFFRTYLKIRSELTNDKKGAVIWNNILKFSYDTNGTYSKNSIGHSKLLEEISINILKEEIQILKPNIIIFTTSTGQGYDRLIKQCFNNNYTTDMSLYEKNNLWKFKADKILCYRTRYPSARKFNGKQTVNRYYQMIIEDILKHKIVDGYSELENIIN